MRFPAKMTSSCIWVGIPVDWAILLYDHVITKILDNQIFLPTLTE